MSFLSPWFLAGLVALGLPLWLHLLERQNPVRIPFSSLMFFQRRTERSIRHRRLRYLLLLAARLALLALLALAFARPALKQEAAAILQGPHVRLIAIDTSLSMAYGDRWQRVQSEAATLVNRLGPGDRAQVIAFGPGVRVMNDATDDRGVLRAALASLKPTASRNSYGELGQTLRGLAQNAALPAEVHVLSDFQQSAMPARFADLSLPPTASLEVHNVASGESRNWCVESVKGATRFYEKASPRIEVTVAGFETPAATRRVTLSLNGRTVATKSVQVPEQGRATVEFTGFDVPIGHSRGEVRIDSADPLPGDDARWISFERTEPLVILFVREPGRTREALYYRTALGASEQAMFAVREVSPAEAATVAPERFAFVVLADIARLSSALEHRLKGYVEAGGAALVIMGSSVSLSGQAALAPRRVSEARYTARDQERFQQVSHADISHPALRGSKKLAGVKFFRYARWEAPADRTLARFADGSPFLVEEPLGAGRLLVMTSPPDNIWNDLPVHPLFVPFVAESARYLAGVDDAVTQATIDSVLELKKRREPRSTVEVLDPAGRRALTLAEAVASRELPLASTGFYEIRRGGGQVELVAVNSDSRESDLRPIAQDSLAMWRSTGRTEAAAGPVGPVRQETPPRDFWRTVLFLAALLAVLESVLGNHYLGLQREVQTE